MTSPIAIVCAMEWELAHAVRSVRSAARDDAGMYVAELDGVPLVLAYCGMGMANAAAGASAVISRYAPCAVLNYGCAGAHRLDLLPGDIVVGTRLVAYDSMPETPDGADLLEADATLLESARCLAANPIEAWPRDLGWPTDVEHRTPRVVFGTVASADRWNRSPESIQRLVEQHDSLCEDMEAAAIGLVCERHHTPFLSIKDISNNEQLRATSSGRAMLEEIGVDQLARRAAAFTLATIRAWSAVRTLRSG